MAHIEKRIMKNGTERHRVRIEIKGFPLVTKTFRRDYDAKKWAKIKETEMMEGRFFKHAEAQKHTVKELIERYEKEILPSKSKAKQDQQVCWWKEKIGHLLLSDVTPAIIVQYRDELSSGMTHRKQKRSPGTVLRYMMALSHVFSIAVQEWQWMDDSPMRKISKPRPSRGRVRFLDEGERERLLKACQESANQYLYPIVILALSTGMRKSEILNLRWSDVDFFSKRITLNQTKNGEIRIIPLVGLANTLLKDLSGKRSIVTNLLFPSKDLTKPIDIRSAWEVALKRAEITNYSFHDNRHSCASYLLTGGASLGQISEILGHKSIALSKRYSHLCNSEAEKKVEEMNQRIFGGVL